MEEHIRQSVLHPSPFDAPAELELSMVFAAESCAKFQEFLSQWQTQQLDFLNRVHLDFKSVQEALMLHQPPSCQHVAKDVQPAAIAVSAEARRSAAW